MPTAILVDGGFFVKRYRKVSAATNHYDPKAVARDLFTWCLRHLEGFGPPRSLSHIFLRLPSHRKESPHSQLRKLRKVALRLGRLADHTHWAIRPEVTKQLLSGKIGIAELSPDDVHYDVRQKGVDMRIGLDIASLAFKRQVDQVVLVAGDSDFVPAAKLARREGIDFILDPMWQPIPDDLHEHIDGLRTTCPQPMASRAQ